MRRGVGLAAFERHNANLSSYNKLSADLTASSLASFQSKLNTFRSKLQQFALEHREDIRKNPEFRQEFQAMCANLGVDVLSGGKGAGMGGWWAELTGMGDFYVELGVQVVDLCVGLRERNGGMLEMQELLRMINKLRGINVDYISPDGRGHKKGKELEGMVTEQDVERAIGTLQPLGAGYTVVAIGSRRMVRSVPKELDMDQARIISLAMDLGGKVWVDLIVGMSGWKQERASGCLESMLREGLCWFDGDDEDCNLGVYWVMSVLLWE